MEKAIPVKSNGNVKWPHLVIIACSLFAIFTTVSVFAFGQAIGIDIRAQEGIDRVDIKATDRAMKNSDAIVDLMRVNMIQHTAMMGDLREIKAKIGIENQ